MDRWQFTGHIAGAGTSGGTRLVLGVWDHSPHGPFADLQRAFPSDERRHADFDAGDVGDCVERTWSAIEGNSEIPRARSGLCGSRQCRQRLGLRLQCCEQAVDARDACHSPSVRTWASPERP